MVLDCAKSVLISLLHLGLWSFRFESTGCTFICSECKSDHVVQLAIQSAALSTSTPLHCPLDQNGGQYFIFDDKDTPVCPRHSEVCFFNNKLVAVWFWNVQCFITHNSFISLSLQLLESGQTVLSHGSPLHLTQSSGVPERDTQGDADFYYTAQNFMSSSLTNQSEAWADQSTSLPISFNGTDGLVQGTSEGPNEWVADRSCHNSYQKHHDQHSSKHTEGSNHGE